MTTIEFDRARVDAVTAEGEVRILHDTTLRLAEHRVAVIGANGSGKSTLARLVNGLVAPTGGRVLVDGRDVAEHGRAIRRRVAFCFADPATQIVMPTAIEDVALSVRRRHRRPADRLAAATAVLHDFGLAGLEHRSVHALSGGQRQLLAIAGVLATDPAILVADEPTTLLDLRNARHIGDVLMTLSQQLVLVTHDLELAARCDRAILLEAGRVVADGPPAQIIDTYRRLP